MWSVAAVLVTAFIMLGLWQGRRLTERRAHNAAVTELLAADPVPVADVFASAAASLDVAALEWTRVSAAGAYLPSSAVMVRNQTNRGEAGFHLVVPMVVGEEAVFVNLGWLPLATTIDEARAIVPVGPQQIEGLVRASQQRPPLGREEPDGLLTVVNRIDIDRLQFQVAEPLLPFWIQLTGPDDPSAFPIPVPQPTLEDGPHLSYMVQWFSFAAIAIGGVAALARRDVQRERRSVHPSIG